LKWDLGHKGHVRFRVAFTYFSHRISLLEVHHSRLALFGIIPILGLEPTDVGRSIKC